ncbi:unnamed protein product [Ambrosiozyma monospora]|uniref:Unnamed protein product n=1 Tax=Ambrosiozyma monospora TaxID=43982 RepID=A0ACB5TZA1_AMBMO|nr:unnamed protein product [Ambrosiozyma monospora]
MADQPPEDLISSLYPPPPPYVKFFTNENVAKVKQLQKEGKTNEDISELKDLRFLVPPKPPARVNYRSFGDIWNFEDKFISLKDSGIQQLYENTPTARKSKGEAGATAGAGSGVVGETGADGTAATNSKR